MADAPIQIEVHTPERRQRRGVTVCAGCCCCCCCLHTVGGLIGALVGAGVRKNNPAPPPSRFVHPSAEVLAEFHPETAPRKEDDATDGRPHFERIAAAPIEPDETREPEPPLSIPSLRSSADVGTRKGMSATGLYWLVVLGLLPVATIGSAVYYKQSLTPDNLVGTGFAVAVFGFPGVQVAAAVVSAFLVSFWPPEKREEALAQIGWIALYSFIGTVLGIGLMALCCLPMMR